MREEVCLVTQPVELQKEEKYGVLKYHLTERAVIEGMEHLREISQYFRGERQWKNRILLQCPETYSAYQAAAAIQSLLAEENLRQEEETEEEWELPDSENWYEDEGREQGKTTCQLLPQGQDYLVVAAGELAGEREEEEIKQAVMLQMTEEQGVKQLVRQAQHLLVVCGRERIQEERLMAQLDRLNCETILVCVPDLSARRELAERLLFEQGFVILSVEKPKPVYYEMLLQHYIEARGRKLWNWKAAPELLEELRHFRGKYFNENDLFLYVEHAAERAGEQREELTRADFALPRIGSRCPAQERLRKMVGLTEVKKQIERLCAVRVIEAEYKITKGEQPVRHQNLIFSGMPGTGKSEAARLYSRILAENHVTNGRFISAKRSEMIGKYVGHTAPRIQKLFEQAEGGILFIDEAGALTLRDDFTKEAVTELVRFMEENPQTTVIFAAYPDKIQEFLHMDEGLASRISKILQFPSYGREELAEIFLYMVNESGWELENGWEAVLDRYIVQKKQTEKKSFGNAREMRKLMEAAVEYSCGRMFQKSVRPAGSRCQITVDDLKHAAKELLPKKQEKRQIGFVTATENGAAQGGCL